MTGAEAPREGWSPSQRELERRRARARLTRNRMGLATLATIVVIGGLAAAVLLSPGWPRVRESFFDGFHARESLPAIVDGFWINVMMFLIAEPIILVIGLAIALARSSRSPLLVPLRGIAVVYTDVVRGIPTLLLVFLFAFGMPALELQGLPDGAFFWATVALVVSYSAYVAEVFRSGIESVHPSQVLSAQALALSRGQAMRYVVVPQATRRVVPPLLNDFVSLQKDTALVASVSIFDALFTARDYANYNFNYTPYVVVACFFVAMTVPLARLCDWLAARVARRERAGAL
ncbi:amino acid ABC transporter permease [Nocardioides sp. HM23]|uniref:amino acid ABC transporter permease n=1 Tax=Nocardioides bizhenqiangii TaxID=3095076 RepID=UPI002ACA30D7|nr:amino acid ABC transporter permease [Nocardioides sp. HM23]MDZ5619526.1 amino acid ABC transporter permease [Nocardioides sp. HM23]